MTPDLRRAVLGLCWLTMVCGALLFAAGAYTGFVEGVEADEAHAAGRLMPAEVAAFVLGPVLAIAGGVVLLFVRLSRAPVPGAH